MNEVFQPFITVLADPMFFLLQTKADENEVSAKDTNRLMEEISSKNRADSGIANPGREVRLKRNPCYYEKLQGRLRPQQGIIITGGSDVFIYFFERSNVEIEKFII